MEIPHTIDAPFKLHGKLGLPPEPKISLLFAHPHPLYGGNMDNNVVRLACHHFNRAGIATLRFDFRGVRASEGVHDHGTGEREDLSRAFQNLRGCSRLKEIPTFVAGYSFGSWVAWHALPKLSGCRGLILVSPPIRAPEFDYPRLAPLPCPVLVLAGDRDDFGEIRQGVVAHPSFNAPVEQMIFPHIDHFWIGHEKRLADTIHTWMERVETSKS